MPVDSVQTNVAVMVPRWEQIDDVVKNRVKEDENREKYLPMPNPDDTSPENMKRYDQYVLRALFVNYLRRTLDSFVGTITEKDPVLKLPQQMEYLATNMDGNGLSFNQQLRKVLRNVLSKGRYGILATFPDTSNIQAPDGFISAAAAKEANLRGYAVTYHPKDIIRVRTKMIGAVKVLDLVVLKEEYNDSADEFNDDAKCQYRVLRLGKPDESYPADVYYQELYREGNVYGDPIVPKRGDRSNFDYIPFVAVGSDDNDADTIDEPPLFDLSEVNLAHYRNSADFEESAFILGQPQVWATGLTDDWIKDVWGGKMYFGSRAVLTGPEGAAFGIMQAQANTLPQEGMKTKEEILVKLGAKLVMPNKSTKTATQSNIDNKSDNSVLSSIAENTEDAFLKVFSWLAEFNRVTGTIELDINKSYGAADASPQLIQAWLGAVMQGAMSLPTFLSNMKQGGQLPDDVTPEQEIRKINNEQDGIDAGGDVDTLDDEEEEQDNTPPSDNQEEPEA